jgi:hypothetical protein
MAGGNCDATEGPRLPTWEPVVAPNSHDLGLAADWLSVSSGETSPFRPWRGLLNHLSHRRDWQARNLHHGFKG